MTLLQAIGDGLVDSVVSDNIPIFTEAEKFNEAVSSIVKRVDAKLTGAQSNSPRLPQQHISAFGTYKSAAR